MTMVWRASVFALLLALAALGPALTQEGLTGVASVIDGDTIEVHGQRIRCTASTHPKAANSVYDQPVIIGVAGSRQALRRQI
jgi:endonuclease YncB( thermonuclease family)